MQSIAKRNNTNKFIVLTFMAIIAVITYMLIDLNFENSRLLSFAMKIRFPKLIVMIIVSISIGGASIIFQSVINNRIVTPCLLGMNSLYSLIHTAVVFFAGSASIIATNSNLSFAFDLILMAVVATTIYSYLFKKNKTQCFICTFDRNSFDIIIYKHTDNIDKNYGA